MKKLTVLACVILALSADRVFASAQPAYEPTWESLSRVTPAPEWFRDAKFGIYFHWGLYSVPAYDNEWYPRHMYDTRNRVYRHHAATWGEPNEFGYADFVPMFKAEKFDAAEWVDLFVRAGARFAGPVAEHHDGWSMWASKLTPWNAKDRGPQRDLVGELEQAVRARGLRFITTFHHARNNLWQRPGRGDRLVWTGHYQFVQQYFPSLLEDPERAIMYGYMPREEFLDMWLGKLKEVIDNYRPDIMWFDSWLDEISEEYLLQYLAYYYNAAQEWDRQVVVTRKQDDLPLSVSVEDIEKGRADRLTEHVWLTDDTISTGSWCYTHNLRIKPTSVVLHSLIDIISKNGVLLLNISPRADGTIPDNQRQVLLEMGEWLQVNGEAVYGTRPWKLYGEGPSKGAPGQFGGITDPRGGYRPEDIRFTTKGDTLYAISLGLPEKELTIQSLKAGAAEYPGRIDTIQLLGSNARIQWTRTDEGLTIQVPQEKPCNYAVVFKITGRQ